MDLLWSMTTQRTTRPEEDARRAAPILGAVLIGALALLPLLIGLALAALTHLTALRYRWLIGALAFSLTALLIGEPRATALAYLEAAPVWRLPATHQQLGTAGLLQALAPITGPGALAIAIGARLWWERRRPFWREKPPRRTPGQKRRARRTTKAIAAGDFDAGDELLLGTDEHGEAVTIAPEEVAQHGLIVGATGSGKTHTLLQLLSEAVRRERALVVVDLKADPGVAARLAEIADAHDVAFRHWSMTGDLPWDPLAHGDALELTDKLIGLEDWSEPHYRRAAERYLRITIETLLARDGRARLDTVAELLAPGALQEALNTRAEAGRPADLAWLAANDPSTVSAVGGLANRIAVLAHTDLGERLIDPDGTGLDLAASLTECEVVLLSLDAPRYPETAPHLARLVMSDLGTIASRRLQAGDTSPAIVAVDEFSAMRSDAVLPLLARARSAGLGLLLATQELSDLDRVDPAFADQVLGNVALVVAHRQNVASSCERLAAIAGTETTWAETLQVDELDGRASGMGTVREVERFVIHPNRLKALGIGEAVLVRRLRSHETGVRVV